MDRIENPALMEPLLPSEGSREIEDLAYDLRAKTAGLAAKLPSEITSAVGELARSMNCYYSNLIEGHNTHPVDIERALKGDYSQDFKKRNLQKEAFAHISLQKQIDLYPLPFPVISREFVFWLHREFYSRLPDEMLANQDPATGKRVRIVPGRLRDGDVKVGDHLAPVHTKLNDFIALFEDRYRADSLSKVRRLIAVAAAHHRLLWIHPFYDGNGRVARLHSHAALKEAGVGSSLWSVARGLARNVEAYRDCLSDADKWRLGDWDGRGNLSEQGLVRFCSFFLKTCIDQVGFMESLLEPGSLVNRVQTYCEEKIAAKVWPRGSFEVLREILLNGSLERGQVPAVTGYRERQSRSIIAVLTDAGVLVSTSPRGSLLLNIPHYVVEAWFPKLYPPDAAS